MNIKNKLYVGIILCMMFGFLSISMVPATNIIYSYKADTGPGVVSTPIPISDNVVIPIIPELTNLDMTLITPATKSELYLHDGVYYKKGESKGSFSISGYCACTKCGTGTGITASGKPVRANHTISADTKVLPMGTVIILENAVGKDGQIYDGVYVVEDRGGGVKNNHIDIYRPTHDLASLVTHYGGLHGDVYIAEVVNADASVSSY